ncbi:riboflavin synthase [Longirhabdus pacifica]|uniref:riboflavin synthase n=1 Tax=Longirhabdus pacifica TaxID=2305227 RepID=UPI001009304F|nr:riboflavin synthase [Longirhabdus pacifica]
MFTGIIEELGRIEQISNQGHTLVLKVKAKHILEDVKNGDSIAVNGVCLTVIAFDNHTFTVDVMPETYNKTNLHELQKGHIVNLERAMIANGRFGGHIVQGHVDGIAKILSKQIVENAVVFTLQLNDTSLMPYVMERGSITIDGISLTVIKVTQDTCSVSIIPHTLQYTNLQHKGDGHMVNIETDIIGKYIKRLLSFDEQQGQSQSTLNMEMLIQKGFA